MARTEKRSGQIGSGEAVVPSVVGDALSGARVQRKRVGLAGVGDAVRVGVDEARRGEFVEVIPDRVAERIGRAVLLDHDNDVIGPRDREEATALSNSTWQRPVIDDAPRAFDINLAQPFRPPTPRGPNASAAGRAD